MTGEIKVTVTVQAGEKVQGFVGFIILPTANDRATSAESLAIARSIAVPRTLHR